MKIATMAIAAMSAFAAMAQIVERPRPEGWERLVTGGRFMDRFEKPQVIGNGWTDKCWGGDNVRPRDVRNGIEDSEYSYWGGNITNVGSEYHLFVARWKESEPRGHMFWPHSEVAHAVSSRPDGDFKVVEVLGKGHNPELFRCKDGSWAVYCIDDRKPYHAHFYRSTSINGPWKYERMQLDYDGKDPLDGESNFSFCTRPDGSILAVCRGGGIWLSEDGIKPFVRKSEGSVYPDVAGRFEDPVIWRDEVQYHMIVNDWLGRVAWKLTSPDGFVWTTQPGEAYMPGIAPNDWFKYERMKVLQDESGRVVQANFAVIDCVKKNDKGGDMHSSKNITIPVNPGRRVQTFRKTRKGLEVRIAKERGFDPLADVDVESLILGPQSLVAYGQGVKPVGTAEAAGDLVVIFPPIELDTPVMQVLGKERSGRLFFATFRTDGTKLGRFKYEQE
ncbi:MAG: glycoside hydrolase family protein [Kiritimatiellae bacterium]|nr:glycoside hydrolase family protein [Kiritimatiellia bacterium]